jgi:hypothetical protein
MDGIGSVITGTRTVKRNKIESIDSREQARAMIADANT